MLTRSDRLGRWADLVDREPARIFSLLPSTWAMSPEQRSVQSVCGSALELACRDPILRVAGLATMRVVEAQAFMALSDFELDRIVSSARRETRRDGLATGRRIRAVANRTRERCVFAAALAFAIVVAALLHALVQLRAP